MPPIRRKLNFRGGMKILTLALRYYPYSIKHDFFTIPLIDENVVSKLKRLLRGKAEEMVLWEGARMGLCRWIVGGGSEALWSWYGTIIITVAKQRCPASLND